MSTSDRLYTLLYGTWNSPKRISRMNGPGSTRKYCDIAEYSYNRALLADHLAGRETYATTLGLLGEARAGCKDYDEADEAEIVAAQDAATARGITTVAFLLPDDDNTHAHFGGHLWTFYDAAYPESDIRAQLRTIPRTGKGEDYPSGNPVRNPFGYHKTKKTRGVLRLPDGRRFRLDTPDGFCAGLTAFFALPLNGKPEPATAHDTRSIGQSWGDAYNADAWKDLPAGGPLWRSPWISACAKTRPDLAKLLRNERVTIANDDSDSAQVAALAYNLSSADVDRQQARAIADYLKPQLRPGKTLEHYRAHFDAEWDRYKPSYYTGRLIRSLGPEDGDELQPLPAAQHKPERKSRARKDRPQKVAGAVGYLEWLRSQVDAQSGSVMLSQAECARRLGCHVQTIKRYEQQLGDTIERRVFARRQAGCLFILVSDVDTTSPADVVAAKPTSAQQDAPNAQPVSMQEEHPAPDTTTPCPAPAPTLTARELVAEAFDYLAVGGARLSFSRVRRYVEDNAGRPVHAAAIEYAYNRERDKRQRDRTWKRQIDSLPTMRVGKLNALDKRVQRVLADGPSAKTYTWAAAIYPHIAAELERRAEISDRITPRRRRTVEQTLLLAEVEEQLAEHRASTKRRKGPIAQAARLPSAAGVPPCPAAASNGPGRSPVADAAISRLFAARDQRQGASGYD